ncbi:MAG TPA: class I SAM-dependent methyltransferase [Candidatus Dormibacteraeota bacterium]|jgi:hypothetical protein|nr:class I SAM-dependent methyltransferase [Candidatus Dormibacteraeota bacterium]
MPSAPEWPPSEGHFHALEALGPEWHARGIMPPARLRAIAAHLDGPPAFTGETGAGISTLFFSNASARHVVFSLGQEQDDDTMARIRASPLFRAEGVEFVLGPSQLTLPGHRFDAQLDLFLIDGPHAYPFPELEYYHVYPHLRPGALLVVDDVQIPTIRRLFEVLREDDMFEPVEVVKTTAILRRTGAPAFPPTEDNWWSQAYNRRRIGEPTSAIGRLVGLLPAPVRTPIRRVRKRFLRD